MAAISLASCGRLRAMIDPPTPRPPAPTDFAPPPTIDAARLATVFEATAPTTPEPPPTATATPTAPPAPTADVRAATATSNPPTRLPPTAPPTPPAYAPLKAAQLRGLRYERQTFNNCGPATTAMLLSYFGRAENQGQIASVMRPNRDDKNVSPVEIAAYAQGLGYGARILIGADVNLLRAFVSNGLPVVVESWYIAPPDDQMGHYKLLTGYDGDSLFFDDTLHGQAQREAERDFDAMWKVFNRTAIVVWKPEQAALARRLMGARADDAAMRSMALASARKDVDRDPQDKYAWFNAGSTLLAMGEAARAARAFDVARGLKLPWRMLWYQFGPYEAYFGAGEYATVIQLATQVLSVTNGLEESRYWRGRAYAALGRAAEARADFEAALKDNANFTRASDALKALGG